ncbi:C-type lectin domain family 4 member F-like isoform X2 [Carassius carassius]|uniref:C-type lectin domain family 4 member F-like isoform X2 n=1 Tax=Carassius carassius TaxID=217509 RepID=UPI0028692F10|nr:C-type lectin domain family 4 member F-like isoform X2 [Carassius carassius]
MTDIYANRDFVRLKYNKQPTSVDEADRCTYGNSDDLDLDPKTKDIADASEHTFSSRKEKDPSCKAVLLAVLSVSLLVALCVLGILYSQLLRSSDLLKEQNRNAAADFEIQEQIPTDSTFERRKYYYFSSEKLNWMESRDYCTRTGGQLVTITGKEDQYNLASKLKEPHWIGLHDLYTEGHWMWVDNTTLSGEMFWHKRTAGLSEPDNWTQEDSDGEDCACLEMKSEWFDAPCSKLKKFICEK